MGSLPHHTMATWCDIVTTHKVLDWAAYAFRTFVLQQVRPYLFGLVITDECNLNCFYCKSKNTGLIRFTFEDACHTLKVAYRKGHRALFITGGEPTVWHEAGKGLRDLVDIANRTGFNEILVYSNGTNPLDIIACKYSITIDGPRDVHNRIRSQSFDRILDNVANSENGSIFASFTVTRANAAHLEETIRAIADTGLFRGIQFNLLTDTPDIVGRYGVHPTQRRHVLDRIWQMKQQGYPIELSRSAYLALLKNDWPRPVRQIEIATPERVFTCCRDVDNPSVCEHCGYVSCAEISQVLALKPSAIWQVVKMSGIGNNKPVDPSRRAIRAD